MRTQSSTMAKWAKEKRYFRREILPIEDVCHLNYP